MGRSKVYYFLFIVSIILTGSCRQISHEAGKSDFRNFDAKYVINSDITWQTIDNFGASDAWSMQYIGHWPLEKQKQMATWLFSTENDDLGNPKGIGLSLWRFNIGAGSKEQGDSSRIKDPWRRSECFLSADRTYNWNKQEGQRNFMKLAKANGVNQFLGFVYSPPVYWTQNGLATNLGRGGSFNIRSDKKDDFAAYLADVIQAIQLNDNISISYIAPFNEPDGHWNWNGNSQEGTAATKYEIADITRLINGEFEKRQLSTQIILPESSDYHCMYATHPLSKADRGYQIQSYFSPDSSDTYIGNLEHVPHLIAGHSYWTTTPLSTLKEIRTEMNDVLKKHKVKFWQTELCVMSNDTEIDGGLRKDLSMQTALYIARIIHHDLVYANASAWHWWRAVANTDYKDGLIYTEPDKTGMDGTYTDSKLMWAVGNYSRFIRPGAVRLGVKALNKRGEIMREGDTNPHGLMISAYRNPDNSLATVVINYSKKDQVIMLEPADIIWQPYITSENDGFNLKKLPRITGGAIKIPARCVITITGINENL